MAGHATIMTAKAVMTMLTVIIMTMVPTTRTVLTMANIHEDGWATEYISGIKYYHIMSQRRLTSTVAEPYRKTLAHEIHA